MMTFAEKMEERGIQKGKQEGMLEGETRGKQEGKQDIALKMINEGVELAFISKVTDLSLTDLKRLQKKI
jgi:predicted transposase/invertase (TIGR01784 family)